MPAVSRGRRRAPAPEDDADEYLSTDGHRAAPRNEEVESDGNGDGDGDVTMGGTDGREDSDHALMVKKLVRYALACEYSRTPIRRDGIKEKVLGPNGRAFKKVFEGAQRELAAVFGMRMEELPARDRATMTAEQKRKAAKSQANSVSSAATAFSSASSGIYMVVSTLQPAYRCPKILHPQKIVSQDGESAYVALYTTLISIIALSGGEVTEPQLSRILGILNIRETMPSLVQDATEKTDAVLQRMIRQGYLVKVVETGQGRVADDEAIAWHVGPRGKVEVNSESVANLVRTVYDGSTADLDNKLLVSLGVRERKPNAPIQQANDGGRQRQDDEGDQAEEQGQWGQGASGRGGRVERRSVQTNGKATRRRSGTPDTIRHGDDEDEDMADEDGE